ncbi:fused MFS/spermidine synthase [Aeropyrum camini]|uniref:Polyamine aminopropyltransferase n=1 Tax=Aeropyrum camini SY1 = JCM 12091 TaxID=1198449 RepID=U3T908_9CREN|nr:fused MFS/spermidine synthase [Aeropyrum camini]BAN90007.1 spermidine synthase [Aeropyrum camini SY1 = JCM 12091]
MAGGGEKSVFLKWSWFLEWLTPDRATLKHVEEVLFQGRSRFQEIAVIRVSGEGKVLVLDGKTQSSESDEYIYHEALVHPAMILHGGPRKVLILGGGEGATLREVLKHRSVEKAVMVDIDETVVNVAREYLGEWHRGAFDDPRAEVVIDDAWNYVARRAETGFDVVIADLVDPLEAGPATRLYSEEYYRMVKEVMGPGGVFVTQAVSISHLTEYHAIIRNTVARVFKHVESYGVYIPSFDSMWGFVVASDEKDPGALGDRGFFEARLSSQLQGAELRFLDYGSMLHMLNIPKVYREAIARERRYATLENQVFLPA